MCKVEQEGDTFYLYNATDEKFVGQGNSMQNFQVLSENLQKHIMIVAGDDDVVDRFQKLDPESVIERV